MIPYLFLCFAHTHFCCIALPMLSRNCLCIIPCSCCLLLCLSVSCVHVNRSFSSLMCVSVCIAVPLPVQPRAHRRRGRAHQTRRRRGLSLCVYCVFVFVRVLMYVRVCAVNQHYRPRSGLCVLALTAHNLCSAVVVQNSLSTLRDLSFSLAGQTRLSCCAVSFSAICYDCLGFAFLFVHFLLWPIVV